MTKKQNDKNVIRFRIRLYDNYMDLFELMDSLPPKQRGPRMVSLAAWALSRHLNPLLKVDASVIPDTPTEPGMGLQYESIHSPVHREVEAPAPWTHKQVTDIPSDKEFTPAPRNSGRNEAISHSVKQAFADE